MKKWFSRKKNGKNSLDGVALASPAAEMSTEPNTSASATLGTASSSSRKRKHFPCGFKDLQVPPSATIDIIFLHGLTGDREKTWTHQGNETSWPQTLLPTKIPQARILTFGYDAYITHFQDIVSKNRIGDHAKTFLKELANKRHLDGTNERPIIFVAHSLGGLVCEDALLAAKNSAEEREQKILESTRGIAFMGTPHNGSGFAAYGQAFAKYLGFMKQTNTGLLQVLRQDSEVLARIHQEFYTMIRAREKQRKEEIMITCFFEEVPLRVVGCLVVSRESAILGQYGRAGIHKNHMDMTKFADEDDPGFKRVVGELEVWVKDMTSKTELGKLSVPCT